MANPLAAQECEWDLPNKKQQKIKHVGSHHGKSKPKQKSKDVHVHDKRKNKQKRIHVYRWDFELNFIPSAPFREMIIEDKIIHYRTQKNFIWN